MGSDPWKMLNINSEAVSIHAPTWGATLWTHSITSQPKFQSTLPHGERLSRLIDIVVDCSSFNPRSHMGSDMVHVPDCHFKAVSIHAPTWGATLFLSNISGDSFVSIHAPTWGATVCGGRTLCITLFQSTLPHGERRGVLYDPLKGIGFNPRSHMGSDLMLPKIYRKYLRFNPRSHMGSDRKMLVHHITIGVSIHAPTWGATV